MNEQWCSQISEDIGYIKGAVENVVNTQKDHNTRLSKLEGFKSFLLGATAIVSGLFTAIFEWLKGGHNS